MGRARNESHIRYFLHHLLLSRKRYGIRKQVIISLLPPLLARLVHCLVVVAIITELIFFHLHDFEVPVRALPSDRLSAFECAFAWDFGDEIDGTLLALFSPFFCGV